MKKITLSILFLSFTILVNGQLQNSKWYFGSYAGLSFSDGSINLITDSAMDAPNASASVSDESGNLLFYTNGSDIYNKNHQPMVSSGLLNGDINASSVLIAPNPINPLQYYVFTVNADYTQGIGLNYSIVDMSLDGGNGDILILNTNLLPHTSEKMTITQTSDGLAYWLVVLAPSTDPSITDTFYSFKINELGINQVTQTTFGFLTTPTENSDGQMKISPDNASLALVNNTTKSKAPATEVSYNLTTYDFNEATGEISNMVYSYQPFNAEYYGVEFSPDSNLLYVSESNVYSSNTKHIYQIQYRGNQSVYNVHTTDLSSIYSIQRGADDKLYVATDFDYLSVINKPNAIGALCEFQLDAANYDSTGTAAVLKGLPQLVPNIILSLPPAPVPQNPIILGNPIKDDLKIKFDDVQTYTVEIYNSISNTIDAPEPIMTVIYEDMKNKKVYHVDVSTLPEDTYYLIIKDQNDNIWHETVIKVE